PPIFSNGSPQNTRTVFRSNDLKIWESLSNVGHPASVRLVRDVVDPSGSRPYASVRAHIPID
ncbi:MAG: hypothetical protein NWS01_09665, partial [Burkholderiales bacterium]|nr:hypothetical protein [Burkholderiales bacterium]